MGWKGCEWVAHVYAAALKYTESGKSYVSVMRVFLNIEYLANLALCSLKYLEMLGLISPLWDGSKAVYIRG